MFNKAHFVNLLWYLGIGFIGGAISHGFFSGVRSITMASIGIGLFLLGEYLSEESKNRKELVLFVIIYSVAVGMVSWWLQHFLDSPMRSLRITPVWYFVSLCIFPVKHPQKDIDRKRSLWLGLIVSVVIYLLLYTAIHTLPDETFWWVDHHEEESNH